MAQNSLCLKAIVELLLTTRDSCSISGVELTAGGKLLVDVVSGGIKDSFRRNNNM